MKEFRVSRHCCHPSQVVRSGGGPTRRNGTSGLSSLGGWSTILVLLIFAGKEEHVAFPETGPQRRRRLRGDGDGRLSSATTFGIDAVMGLVGPLRPAQWGHVCVIRGVQNPSCCVGGRQRWPVGPGRVGLSDLAGVLGAFGLGDLG